MNLLIPEFSLVMLVGVSGSGKSTFARQHFKPTEIVASDVCRALVSDDESNQAASKDAFEVMHLIAAKRLGNHRLTVIDATNLKADARRPLAKMAADYRAPLVAILFNLPEALCQVRNKQRLDRAVSPNVITRQIQNLRYALDELRPADFKYLYRFDSPEAVDTATIQREPSFATRALGNDRGPFDIVGDIHGCFDELSNLLTKLGYSIAEDGQVTTPAGRSLIFVGDLVDRGPNSPAVLSLVMTMVKAGLALCVPGNHDDKLRRKLQGRNVQLTHGLADTLEQLSTQPPEFGLQVVEFLDGLASHLVLDNGQLVIAHAGMREGLQGRDSRDARDFALFGATTGESDQFGLPVRLNWAADYHGRALVVYGHTPVAEPNWINNTINIDTGCAFGGKLTALRYPERELVSVPALRAYAESARPFLPGDKRSR